ncbi:hypothetical protein ASD56_06980 [Microbacterium sp. Root166]|jgi:small-conductance mechanosensitive channel|uniref:mechanosensitive ion channel domain-containing protein n=1 Tax=Microbacterium sp. Root166 TaxID=1736478 RepID=UPI0006FA40CA|nr:mechanosensitive ion channel domain-containing protein [Microbacterium sp. Root166]KQZ86007.1 hypothetical protein ASD56_06980 [Microbacterium sp. Root166]
MSDIVSQPWFWPAVIVSVGLPLMLIGLTEFHNALARRGSRAAPIVLMVRNYLVPVAGILVLISQPGAWEGEGTWPRVIWTIFGLLVIVVTINALNHLIFHRAEKGSWRDRFPTIFSDLIRFVFIVLGIAAVFWWVWDADVAGVFAALGITSIVVGLALQNAVGSIVSGLFLIFESPFDLGDWIETGGTRGQVVEVNWRAVHLDTGNGIVVMPTAELAGGSFVNLTRSSEAYAAVHTATFGSDDPPGRVRELLVAVARDLPIVASAEPRASTVGGGTFSVAIPLRNPGDHDAVLDAFATRLWYAARRADLHLDGDTSDDWRTPAQLQDSLRQIAPALSLKAGETDALAAHARLERYCAGESILRPGMVPTETRFILAGSVMLGIPTDDDGFVQVTVLGVHDAVGLTALSRTQTISRAVAMSEVDVVVLPVSVLDEIVRMHPVVAREIVRESENRVRLAQTALQSAGGVLPHGRRVLG